MPLTLGSAAHDGGGGGTADPTLSSGPDYAFTLPDGPGKVRSVLSIIRCRWILVSAQCDRSHVSRSMSLYRAGLKLAFFLPLGVALASFDALGFTDVSSVFILSSRTDATSYLIEPASRSYPRPGLHA